MDRRNGSGTGGDSNAGSRGYGVSGKIMLTAVVAMFTTVLLILFLHLYLRWRFHRISSRRRIRRSRRRRLVFAGEAAGAAPSSRPSRGLGLAVIKSLPVIVFSFAPGEGGGGGHEEEAAVECAVCLCEFEEGEKVRCLPRCGHRFHIECIDMWFHSHATCPLCRSTVEAAPPTPKAVDLVAPPVAAQLPSPAAESSSPVDLLPVGSIGEGMSSSAAVELRIDMPPSGLAVEEEGLGLKSPGSRMLLLRRILSGDLRLYRFGAASVTEPDLEQAETAEQLSSPPPPPPPPHPAMVAMSGDLSYRGERRDDEES